MPYISIKTTEKLTAEKETALKTALGSAISLLPGKSESWLMLEFEGERHMYFKGKNDSPVAFVSVSSFGTVSPSAASSLTAEICGILSKELGVPKDKIYIRYSETELWGWNGSNF